MQQWRYCSSLLLLYDCQANLNSWVHLPSPHSTREVIFMLISLIFLEFERMAGFKARPETYKILSPDISKDSINQLVENNALSFLLFLVCSLDSFSAFFHHNGNKRCSATDCKQEKSSASISLPVALSNAFSCCFQGFWHHLSHSNPYLYLYKPFRLGTGHQVSARVGWREYGWVMK